MNAAESQDQAIPFDLKHFALLGAAVGIAVSAAVWLSPLASVGLLFCCTATLACAILVGIDGFLVTAPAFLAFFLLNRIDETAILPVGHVITLTATLWLTFLFVMALLMRVAWTRRAGFTPPEDPSQLKRFLPRAYRLYCGFTAIGILGIAYNHLFDTHVLVRYLPGEVLALAAILLPLTFLLLIPRSSLSESQTLLCLRGLVGLGGLAGLIMILFGLFPDQMLARLGWSQADGGTLGLIRGRLPIGHPNKVAAVTLLLIPFTAMVGLGGRRWLWRAFHLGCAVLMFAGVLFALSRSALLAMALSLAATFAYLFFTREHRRAIALTLTAALMAVLAAGTFYLLTNYDFSRFWARGYFEDASVDRRVDSMTTAFYVWRDHKILGVSPDAVYPRLELRPGWVPPYGDRISPCFYYEGHVTAETPHNFYLTVLAEFGLAGAGLFFTLLGVIAWTLWRTSRMEGLSTFDKKMLVGALFGLAGFLAMGMFDAMLMTGFRANVFFWIYMGLIMKYAYAISSRSKGKGRIE